MEQNRTTVTYSGVCPTARDGQFSEKMPRFRTRSLSFPNRTTSSYGEIPRHFHLKLDIP
jgi:hypothetical protein